jgi:hypothetical protein
VRSGSYDFSREMFFAGIGASGFVMDAIKTGESPATRPEGHSAGQGQASRAARHGTRLTFPQPPAGRCSGAIAVFSRRNTGKPESACEFESAGLQSSSQGQIFHFSAYFSNPAEPRSAFTQRGFILASNGVV